MNRIFLFLFLFSNAAIAGFSQKNAFGLIDKKATPQTKSLYRYLHSISSKHILFGHQDATLYGHGWYGDSGRSDVKSVTGSHPAIIGVDFSGLTGKPDSQTIKAKISLKKNIEDTYNRGGISTVSWHFNNPVSPTGFYWNDSNAVPAVSYIIPGGKNHEQYKTILKTIGEFAKSTRGKDGNVVPIIFRPFHEFDGGWFWWGKPHCTTGEFISLWRFTVNYLRDSIGVHNFIYAFSPDCKFNDEKDYLERYPGNEYVDLVGFDDYADFGRDGKYDLYAAVKRIQVVNSFAKRSGKLAALTETGLESLPANDWWMNTLLKTLQSPGLELCYVLVWRNDSRSATHYYAPFPGHSSVPDFLNFYNDPYTYFENDLKKVYLVE